MAVIRRADAEKIARQLAPLHLGRLETEGEVMRSRATEDAQRIRDEASAEREKLISTAASEGDERGHKEGYERGLAEGRERGREEAVERAGASLARLEQAWSAALDELKAERASLLESARSELLRLALHLAGCVTRRTITLDDETAVRNLESIFAEGLARSAVRVRVSEGDASKIRDVLPSLAQRFDTLVHATLETDASLDDGSAIIETASGGEIDASTRSLLARIAETALPGGSRHALEGFTGEKQEPMPSHESVEHESPDDTHESTSLLADDEPPDDGLAGDDAEGGIAA